MSGICAIIAGGDCGDELSLIPENVYIICADGGYDHALRFGITPHLVMGDFDSAVNKPIDADIMEYPTRKDFTDTMLAAKRALDMGFDEILIYGALGGRPDHTFANYQTLCFLEKQGVRASLIGSDSRIWLQTGGTVRRYEKCEGYFSLFAFDGTCTGVTLKGTEYPLENAVITGDFPIGVSNHITASYAEVSLETGCLLVMATTE